MDWNEPVRPTHRRLSIAFTVAAIVNIVALAQGGETPPRLVTYSPLLPLAFLQLTGLRLFVRPYTTQWRGRRDAE
jgi:hypothetical protein